MHAMHYKTVLKFNTKNKIVKSLRNVPTLITPKLLNLSKENMRMANHIYKQKFDRK